MENSLDFEKKIILKWLYESLGSYLHSEYSLDRIKITKSTEAISIYFYDESTTDKYNRFLRFTPKDFNRIIDKYKVKETLKLI